MTDLKEMRAVAEKATQESWTSNPRPEMHPDCHTVAVLDDDRVMNICHMIGALSSGSPEANARHISTFDPPTCLALLDRLEAAEARAADGEMEAGAIHAIRQIAKAATGGNCTFVDDDVKRLVYERDLAEKAFAGDIKAAADLANIQADREKKLARTALKGGS